MAASETVFSELENEEKYIIKPKIEQEQTETEQIITKKVWILRISFLFTLVFLMSSNVIIALQINDPLVYYSTLMPINTLVIFFIGWFFFKNPSTGKKVINNELVSVIIPIYNQEALIERVIEAVFESTYPNIEVIAVNDGSKDGTEKILNKLEKRFPCLKVIHKPNEGKRRAVSLGFNESKGKYVVVWKQENGEWKIA